MWEEQNQHQTLTSQWKICVINLGQLEVSPWCLASDEKETGTLQDPPQKYCAWQKQVAPDTPEPGKIKGFAHISTEGKGREKYMKG